jgi:hypothetical protein
MSYGDTQALYAMAAQDSSFDPEATLLRHGIADRNSFGVLAFHVANAKTWRGKVGQVTGQGRLRGQCANLVQTATKVGLTRWWLQGPKVKGNTAVPAGTIIAAGWIDGLYPGKRAHNTACIFLVHHKRGGGFDCLHQWVEDDNSIQSITVDSIPDAAAGDYVADKFHVVLTVRRVSDLQHAENMAEA